MLITDTAQLQSLTNEFLNKPENKTDKDWLVTVVSDEYKEIAKYVEFKLFNDRLSQSPEQMEERYGSYDEQSIFIGIFDGKQKKIAGSLRIIKSAEKELKCFSSFSAAVENGGWGVDKESLFQSIGGDATSDYPRSWEIATIAVLPEYASGGAINGASLGLYHACFKLAIDHQVKYLFAIQEQKPFQNVQQWGEPFSRIPNMEDKPHEGDTLNVASYLEVEQTVLKLKALNADLAGLLIEGRGLENGYDINLG